MRRKKKRQPYHTLKWLYRTLVAISAIILVTYFALSVVIKPPEIPSDTSQVNDTTGEQETISTVEEETEPTPEPPPKIRKSLCYTFLLVASDDGNGNADTIMVMMYDIPKKQVGVISIPRDTAVATERNFPKINSAYANGVLILQEEASNLLGIPIDYYVKVNMDAFSELVDSVGGIDFNVPVDMNYVDPTQDLTIQFKAGYQHLSGDEALEVARFRHNSDGTGYNDNGRMKTQQEIIKTVGRKILSWDSVTKVNRFVDVFMSNVKTDLSVNNMLYFVKEATKLNPDTDIKTATLPGDGTKTYKGVRWCYELDEVPCLQIINDYVNPYVDDLTLDDVVFLDLD